jgi:hypothetical protein
MSNETKSTRSSSSSPSTPDGWDETAGFRETLLRHFPQAEDGAALRHLAAMLHEYALQFASYWPRPAGSVTRAEARAVAGDLRHAQGYLAALGRDREASALNEEDSALSALAEQKAAELGRIAEELERAAG